MIWRNFFRDLRSTASRMVSVIIITLIAVTVYTGLNGILYNVDQVTGAYYRAQNTADYWITGAGLDMEDCRTLGRIPGVTGVQPRIVWEGQERGNEDLTLRLYAEAKGSEINLPYLVSGSLPGSNREMVLSDVYARARGLSPGDFYEITLTGTGLQLRLQISGLVKSPECQYHFSAATPAPDLTRYGFAYLSDEALSVLTGTNTYNQICLTVDGTADDAALRRDIGDRLGNKVVNILSREDNQAAYFAKGTTDGLAPVIRLFPILFFLCAVLLMVSNMSRLIEHARSAIGTFKALGYYDGTILRYYLLHAVLVVLLGFPLGTLPSKPLIRLIVETLTMGSDLPPYVILSDYRAWAEAFLLTAVCCVGSAWGVARSLLRENPAQCMRPKPPKNAKPVLLEHIAPLWKRLSFNQKYIIRSTLRDKARMATCIVGISFCMALVFAAFALRDSLTHYADALTSNQNRYDLMIGLSSDVTPMQYERIARMSPVEAAELEMSTACWFYSERRLTTAMLTVSEDRTALRLYAPYASGVPELPRDGLVLDEDIAEELGVAAGDTVTLRFAGDRHFYAVQVAKVHGSITGAYVSRSLWRELGRPYTPTAAYVTTGDRAALTRELDRYDFVDSWQTRESVTEAAAQRLFSGSLVAYILILFGGALACVVIYNLGIMSFFEQLRNLATLMVLGFHDKEIKSLQLSENIIFALLGICAGLPMGIGLSHVFVAALSDMPLVVATTPLSFALSAAVTLLFALAVNLVIGRRMRDIDMLGALKSVE